MRLAKKKLAILALALAFCVGIVSATLLPYFGKIETTIDVKQAVLVDGIEGQAEITHNLTMSGGETAYECHYLKSQTSVPVDLLFVTDKGGAGDEITVKYYALSSDTYEVTEGHAGWGGDLFDFVTGTYNDTKYGSGEWTLNWNPLTVQVYISEGYVIFDISLPKAMEDGTIENFWIEFNDDEDADWDWQVSFKCNKDFYGKLDEYWGYLWRDDASQIIIESLPDWIIGENIDWQHFKVKVVLDKLGFSFSFAMFVVETPEHKPDGTGFLKGNMGGCVVIDLKSTDYFIEETLLGEEITSPFTLAPDERLDFCIEYYLSPLIASGTYTVTTTITVP